MTTNYAKQVQIQAVKDVEELGYLRATTATALEQLGYDATEIVNLERRLFERVYR